MLKHSMQLIQAKRIMSTIMHNISPPQMISDIWFYIASQSDVLLSWKGIKQHVTVSESDGMRMVIIT